MPTVADDLVIELDSVGVTRSGTALLQDITLRVQPDQRWVVLGPNGAGKTTLLSLAAGRLHPTTGTVRVLDEQLGRTDLAELRTRIGLTTAALAERIPGTERVLDVVLTAAWSVVGRWRERYDELDVGRAQELLGQFGVAGLAQREYGTLSEGERKRVQIARALMTDPELLLLDEPAAGLDLGAREELVGRLGVLAQDPDSPALMLVTHHVEEIPPGFTHALLLRGGTVVAAGELAATITGEHLSETFGVQLVVERAGQRFTARAG
ncbi:MULTISPECIES: ABC transporter ATP-binding protein [unclassified Solwaraspora]|uniref:ABC transporter ATP-binding protein n=1 Tax=unclassified Solwaraspora TaxID=2627926 RepID=UPI00248B865C|nr:MULTISPECIES: ABC transporter ATP-binding protein [unclassified Solwaraspora]WBB98366.1 ABC transporter ATP-binding protein [Solwaraspora sp. WMMA2059]WBC23081.1 ABC transporter ATP-binding protein [Solwaraspora sp. WMMA2080]WJK34885.1 ABC transporter ATP-binding protein [Solwaraspora sp. WMMA2065]